MGFDRSIVLGIHHYRIMQKRFTALKIPLLPLFILLFPFPFLFLEATYLFYYICGFISSER
jgi:hypothetical protein